MQVLCKKNFNFNKKTSSFHQRLIQIEHLRRFIKSTNSKVAFHLDYRELAREFRCTRETIRTYLVKLERAGLLKRYLVPSEVIEGKLRTNLTYIQLTNKENGMNNIEKKGAIE